MYELLDFLDMVIVRYSGNSYRNFTVEKKPGDSGCKKTSAMDNAYYNNSNPRKSSVKFFLVLSRKLSLDVGDSLFFSSIGNIYVAYTFEESGDFFLLF
jgi:hypothetical protein